MPGIKYTNQINMTVPPTEENHVVRKKEINETVVRSLGILQAGDYDSIFDLITENNFSFECGLTYGVLSGLTDAPAIPRRVTVGNLIHCAIKSERASVTRSKRVTLTLPITTSRVIQYTRDTSDITGDWYNEWLISFDTLAQHKNNVKQWLQGAINWEGVRLRYSGVDGYNWVTDRFDPMNQFYLYYDQRIMFLPVPRYMNGRPLVSVGATSGGYLGISVVIDTTTIKYLWNGRMFWGKCHAELGICLSPWVLFHKNLLFLDNACTIPATNEEFVATAQSGSYGGLCIDLPFDGNGWLTTSPSGDKGWGVQANTTSLQNRLVVINYDSMYSDIDEDLMLLATWSNQGSGNLNFANGHITNSWRKVWLPGDAVPTVPAGMVAPPTATTRVQVGIGTGAYGAGYGNSLRYKINAARNTLQFAGLLDCRTVAIPVSGTLINQIPRAFLPRIASKFGQIPIGGNIGTFENPAGAHVNKVGQWLNWNMTALPSGSTLGSIAMRTAAAMPAGTNNYIQLDNMGEINCD